MILDYHEYVTEKGNCGVVNYTTVDSNLKLFTHSSRCPFCKNKIDNVVYKNESHSYPDWLEGSFDQYETVIQCPECGWWEYSYKNQSDAIIDGIRASDIEYSSAIIKKYKDDSTEVPIKALRQCIEKKPDLLYRIDAHKMEDLVRSVFGDFYTNCKVYSFGKTRDGGKDGLIIDADGMHTLLQVKRRTRADLTEGVSALRELMGVAILEDNLRGCVFVSTADHFSKDAEKYAESVVEKKKVETFDLVDCQEFINRLNLTKNEYPKDWEHLVKLNN